MNYSREKTFAERLDAQDSVGEYRSQFSIPKQEGRSVSYFAGNSLGLQPNNASDRMLSLFETLAPILDEFNLKILLETDLEPEAFNKYLDQIRSDRIQVNYDTGNSAYWGYDAQKEISLYGGKIGNIHIKDCTPEDYSVPLGQGNVDFDLSFQKFKEEIIEKGKNHFGAGWVWVIRNGSTLSVQDMHDADNPITRNQHPVLVIDLWEHAYYLDYQNDREKYLTKIFNIMDWNKVSENFEGYKQ